MEAGQTLQGAWSLSGADYIVLDLEHSPTSIHAVLPLLQAAQATGIMTLTRAADHNPTSIKHLLDLGANSVLFPFVENAAQAEALVAACLYAPRGQRGFSKMNRASRYLSDTDYSLMAHDDVMIIAQLESMAALDKMEEIAAVAGIGAVFVGPGDLAASMGLIGQTGHADVKAAMSDCARRAKAIGKPCGTVVGDAEQAEWAFAQGYRFVSISNDLAMMVTTAQKLQKAVRAAR
jgi:2-keto-3-deoxy-L-rhamnonate aldolase RhmA